MSGFSWASKRVEMCKYFGLDYHLHCCNECQLVLGWLSLSAQILFRCQNAVSKPISWWGVVFSLTLMGQLQLLHDIYLNLGRKWEENSKRGISCGISLLTSVVIFLTYSGWVFSLVNPVPLSDPNVTWGFFSSPYDVYKNGQFTERTPDRQSELISFNIIIIKKAKWPNFTRVRLSLLYIIFMAV